MINAPISKNSKLLQLLAIAMCLISLLSFLFHLSDLSHLSHLLVMVSHQILSSLYFLSSFAPIEMASHPLSTFSFNSLISPLFHLSQLQCCHHVPFLLSLSTLLSLLSFISCSYNNGVVSLLYFLISLNFLVYPLSLISYNYNDGVASLFYNSLIFPLSFIFQLQWWHHVPSLLSLSLNSFISNLFFLFQLSLKYELWTCLLLVMAIHIPYPLSTISKIGALNLLVVGNGDQHSLLFFSTFSKFEALDFLTNNGDPPPSLFSSFISFKA